MASAPPLSVPRQRQGEQRQRRTAKPPSSITPPQVEPVPLAQVVTESQVFNPGEVATAVPIQPQTQRTTQRQGFTQSTTPAYRNRRGRESVEGSGGAEVRESSYMPPVLDWNTCKTYFTFVKNFEPTSVLPKTQLAAKASESVSSGIYFNEEERIALFNTPPYDRSPVVFSSYGKWRRKVDKAQRSRSRGREYISHVVQDNIHDGVMSSHERLNSPANIRAFIDYHNSPPSFRIMVKAQRFDNSSEEGVFTEEFEVDLSSYVLPHGKLTSMEKKVSIDDILETYCACENKLKSLGVKKHLEFNLKALFRLIEAYFRSKLSYSNIQCSAKVSNTSIRVTSSEGYPRMWESQTGRVLTSVSVVGGLAMAIQGLGVRRKSIRSTFSIPYSVIQIFKVVVDQLNISTRPFQS